MADVVASGEEELLEGGLAASPIDQLQEWLSDAWKHGVKEANAMCLSTVSADGRPSGRMVLLKVLDERGLSFVTNYASRKGRELHGNAACSATFWWGDLQRQVRVEGYVALVSPEESDEYFNSRPLISRVASAASPQSQVIEDREEIEAMVRALASKYIEGDVPRPPHWGGFRIVPDRFEFWKGRRARLHDRLVYRRAGEGWLIERLAP